MSLKIDPNDATVLLIDLEAGIADKPLTVPTKELKKGVGGLCKIAALFALPVVVSGLKNPDGSDAKFLPEVGEALGNFTIHYRTSADSLENPAIKAAIEATGRRTLLIGGTVTESPCRWRRCPRLSWATAFILWWKPLPGSARARKTRRFTGSCRRARPRPRQSRFVWKLPGISGSRRANRQ